MLCLEHDENTETRLFVEGKSDQHLIATVGAGATRLGGVVK
jgi:hypothetical protein